MKKYIVLIMFLGVIVAPLAAQENDSIQDYYDPEKAQKFSSEEKIKNPDKQKKTSFGIDLGTSVGALGNGTSVNTFIAPHLKYKLSPKFSLNVGGIFVNSTLNNVSLMNYYGERTEPISGNFSSNFIYLEGRYKLTDKLTISGMAFYETDLFKQDQKNAENNSKGFVFGADYKFDSGFSLGIDVGISDGKSPFYNSMYGPHYHNGLGNGYSSRFGSGFGNEFGR